MLTPLQAIAADLDEIAAGIAAHCDCLDSLGDYYPRRVEQVEQREVTNHLEARVNHLRLLANSLRNAPDLQHYLAGDMRAPGAH